MINAKEYWKQAIKDYLECLDEDIELTDEELDRIARKIMCDEGLWQAIEYTIDYYIYHNK